MYARPILNAASPSKKHTVWRFYAEADHWKWQCVSVQGEVIAQSAGSYGSYDQCVADAEGNGYLFRPSQTRKHFDCSVHVRTNVSSNGMRTA